MGFRVRGSGFGVQGFEVFADQDFGFEVLEVRGFGSLGFRIMGEGFCVGFSWFGVLGSGFRFRVGFSGSGFRGSGFWGRGFGLAFRGSGLDFGLGFGVWG